MDPGDVLDQLEGLTNASFGLRETLELVGNIPGVYVVLRGARLRGACCPFCIDCRCRPKEQVGGQNTATDIKWSMQH